MKVRWSPGFGLGDWELVRLVRVHGDQTHYRNWELHSAKRPHHKKPRKPDTRRINAAGKLIGGHTSHDYGRSIAWYRRQYWRAERRHTKAMLRGEEHPRNTCHYRSEYNWRGT